MFTILADIHVEELGKNGYRDGRRVYYSFTSLSFGHSLVIRTLNKIKI